MTGDLVAYIALVVTFGLWVTVHVVQAVAFVLAWRFRLAALGFFVVPVAPVLAYRSGHRVLATLWVVAAIAYVALRLGWGGG